MCLTKELFQPAGTLGNLPPDAIRTESRPVGEDEQGPRVRGVVRQVPTKFGRFLQYALPVLQGGLMGAGSLRRGQGGGFLRGVGQGFAGSSGYFNDLQQQQLASQQGQQRLGLEERRVVAAEREAGQDPIVARDTIVGPDGNPQVVGITRSGKTVPIGSAPQAPAKEEQPVGGPLFRTVPGQPEQEQPFLLFPSGRMQPGFTEETQQLPAGAGIAPSVPARPPISTTTQVPFTRPRQKEEPRSALDLQIARREEELGRKLTAAEIDRIRRRPTGEGGVGGGLTANQNRVLDRIDKETKERQQPIIDEATKVGNRFRPTEQQKEQLRQISEQSTEAKEQAYDGVPANKIPFLRGGQKPGGNGKPKPAPQVNQQQITEAANFALQRAGNDRNRAVQLVNSSDMDSASKSAVIRAIQGR